MGKDSESEVPETEHVRFTSRALTRLVGDPGRARRIFLVAAVLLVAVSEVLSFVLEPNTASRGPVVLVLALTLVLVVGLKPHQHLVLGVAGGLLAFFVPDSTLLWPAVVGLTYLSIVEDPAEVPWIGWVAGGIGSIASLINYNYAASPAPFVAVGLGGSLGLLVRNLERREQLEGESRRLRGQAAWLEQRTSLARELHDVVGHHVTAMVVQAEAGLVGDPARALREIGGLGRAALSELDALVVHLRDPEAPLLVTAPPRLSDIDELLAAPLRHQGVAVTVDVEPDVLLDDATTLTAYRITQEALTNVARHARASCAWVEVARSGGNLRLRVTDDGVGPPLEFVRGSGLVGIEERVAALGGVWSISQRPGGGGTVVDVYLPVAR